MPVTAQQAQLLLEAAHMCMELGRWDTAEEVFDGLCALLPSYDLAWLGRGLLAQARGSCREALGYFRKAQTLAPRSGAVRIHTAEAFVALGRPREAQQEYRVALRLEPTGLIGEVARARLEKP